MALLICSPIRPVPPIIRMFLEADMVGVCWWKWSGVSWESVVRVRSDCAVTRYYCQLIV
jgi:hypothetical protein